MTEFHVRVGGSDSAAGTTPDTAWATIGKVNTELAAGSIRRGDAVLLRRGDTFYGNLAVPALTVPPPERLTIAPYGVGPRPIVSNYKVANIASGWSLWAGGTNVWLIDLVLSSAGTAWTGNITSSNTDVGFLKVNGIIRGKRVWVSADLVAQWDFWVSGTILFVKSFGNPTTLASDIQIAVGGTIIPLQSSMLVADLDVKGSSYLGIADTGNGPGNAEAVGCDIHEIGGGLSSGTTRLGNGVQTWLGTSDTRVHHCDIHDIYDVAMTMQGSQGGTRLGWQNVWFDFNRIWNCNQSFETWATGTTTTAGTGFVNCGFVDNTCLNAGYSWGQAVRPDLDRGTHLLNYSHELPVDLEVKRNVFFDGRTSYFFTNTNGNTVPVGYDLDDNAIFLRPGVKVQEQRTETIATKAAWVAATGHDTKSQWFEVPATVTSVDQAFTYISATLAQSGKEHIQHARSIASTHAELAVRAGRGVQAAIQHDTRLVPLWAGNAFAAPTASIASVSPANGTLSGARIVAGRSCTITSLSCDVTTAGAAGSVIRMGLYRIKETDGSYELLVDGGTVIATTTGTKVVTVSAPVRAGDVLVPVAVGQGAPATAPFVRGVAGIADPYFGGDAGTILGNLIPGGNATGITGALPATIIRATFAITTNVYRVAVLAAS